MNPYLMGPAMKWGGMLISSLALILLTHAAVASESSPVHRFRNWYMRELERYTRALFLPLTHKMIVRGQVGTITAISIAGVVAEFPLWYFLVLLVAVAPLLYLYLAAKTRGLSIERQVEPFLVALANALKSTPNVGAALMTLPGLIENPLRQELDVALKEMKLGATLDDALQHMAARIKVPAFDSAVLAITIGRKVGGNLPKVLESTSGTIREMQRLEGVLKTKTANARAQMWVIGLMPMILAGGLSRFWPGYLDPLTGSVGGYTFLILICTTWATALIFAHRVLAVDF